MRVLYESVCDVCVLSVCVLLYSVSCMCVVTNVCHMCVCVIASDKIVSVWLYMLFGVWLNNTSHWLCGG